MQKALVLLILLTLSTPAQAGSAHDTATPAQADPTPDTAAPAGPPGNLEVSGGPSTLVLAGADSAGVAVQSLPLSGSVTGLGLTAGAFYQLFPGIQLGGRVGWFHGSSPTTSQSAYLIMLGATLNMFSNSLQSSFFLRGLVGFDHNSFGTLAGSSNNDDFVFEAEIGKRFALSEDISYAPSLGVIKTSSANAQFDIVPLAVSLFFF